MDVSTVCLVYHRAFILLYRSSSVADVAYLFINVSQNRSTVTKPLATALF